MSWTLCVQDLHNSSTSLLSAFTNPMLQIPHYGGWRLWEAKKKQDAEARRRPPLRSLNAGEKQPAREVSADKAIDGEAIPPSTSQLQPMRDELRTACICSRGMDYTAVYPNQQETQLVWQLSIITQTISLQFPTYNTEKQLQCFKRTTTSPVKVSCMFLLILIKRLHFATAREEKERIVFNSDVWLQKY